MLTLGPKPRNQRFLILMLVGLLSLINILPVHAQSESQVHLVEGRIEIGEVIHYILPELKKGDTLYVYARHTSGNLNPLLGLTGADVELAALRDTLLTETNALIQSGVDPVEAQERVIADAFLIVDDNGGDDSDAAFEFDLPRDGDYRLLLTSTLTNETFGEYELMIGINAPQVLTGEVRPTGDVIAVLDEEASGIASAVQEVKGSLTAAKPSNFFTLDSVQEGDTLYAYVEAVSGDLIPLIELTDYGGRVLRDPNQFLQRASASFEYTFDDVAEGFRLTISSCCTESTLTEGEYRLLVGVNAPEVLTGNAPVGGRRILRGPIEVQVAIKLQQITEVDQKAENFSVVAELEMRWNDPGQAFNSDDCRCRFKSFLGASFSKFIGDNPFVWPEFTIFNQQDGRWTQKQGMVFWPNGDILYYERFTAKLQAPDFDFRSFPFDTQKFFIRIDSLYPEDFFVFADSPEGSEVGDQLGEEEWVIADAGTTIDSQDGNSRFSFGLTATRHVSFYFFRIILPTLLIVIVSWFTFFLKDYSKRVDVTLANLFVFVAFSFTISGDLPRLGYLTFLDTFLAGTFVITALVLLFNVVLRRLEVIGREELAIRIDNLTIWLYPFSYIAFVLWLWWHFLA